MERLFSKKLLALIGGLGILLFMQRTGATKEDVEWIVDLLQKYLFIQAALDTPDALAKAAVTWRKGKSQ